MTEYTDPAAEQLRQRRKAIFDRVSDRFRERGTPIDTNPQFVALVTEWIEGRVEMTDVTMGYGKIRRAVRRSRHDSPLQSGDVAPTIKATLSQEQLNAELERVIGIWETDLSNQKDTISPDVGDKA